MHLVHPAQRSIAIQRLNGSSYNAGQVAISGQGVRIQSSR